MMDDAANDVKVLAQFCPRKHFPVMQLYQATNVGGYSKLLTLLFHPTGWKYKKGREFFKINLKLVN